VTDTLVAHAARSDVVVILDRLQRSYGSATEIEVQLFAYLALLMHGFIGGSPSSWQYQFFVSDRGVPESPQIAEALESMRKKGQVIRTDGGIRLDDTFNAFIKRVPPLASIEERNAIVRSACDAALFSPLAEVARAIAADPTVVATSDLKKFRALHENEFGPDVLRALEELRAALPDGAPASAAAILWTAYWAIEEAAGA